MSGCVKVKLLETSHSAQILCMGQQVIGDKLAGKLVSEWLGYVFNETSASESKVKSIADYLRGADCSSLNQEFSGFLEFKSRR
jgi:ribose 5-phosphate isomerase RpiB